VVKAVSAKTNIPQFKIWWASRISSGLKERRGTDMGCKGVPASVDLERAVATAREAVAAAGS